MMTMREVSRYFDRVQASNPLTGAPLFLCQFANYDGSKRDAFAAYRRVMSTDPDTVVQPGHVVSALGKTWMLGDDHPDGWDELHRRKFVAHRAAGQAGVQSLQSYLANSTPTSVWADMRWAGDTSEEGESSDKIERHVAILPAGTSVKPYDLISLGGDTMLVRSAALQSSGFMEARGLVQETPARETLSLMQRVFTPATGGYTETSPTPVLTFRARWQEMFRYEDQLDERFQEGDETFAVPVATVVKSGDAFTVSGRRYLVAAVRVLAGVKVIHGRPAI